jgi:hypothetical protein
MEEEAGTAEGDCPFVVHGLIGENYPIEDCKGLGSHGKWWQSIGYQS